MRATGRRKLILCALWTEICMAFPALDALREGYEVYPVVDAIGGHVGRSAPRRARARRPGGRQPVSWVSLACELQRDWAREETVADVVEIVLTERLLTDMTATGSRRRSKAREFLGTPIRCSVAIIDAHPDFRPRAWLDELPPLDAFGTLIFQVAGQQLSVRATRTIVSRLEEHFGGRLPSPAELLAADPQVLRASGLSARKGATLRALAERFVDGRLSDEALSRA